MSEPSLERFRRVVAAATANLDSRRSEVNDLNVFPVADGDTGDNMALTMQAVLDELDALGGKEVDEIGREELVVTVARAALMGARGNSGVILSQIVRGAAEEFASRPGELIDPQLVAAALSRAVDAAYESVQDPAEGTMLTVLRAMSTAISQRLAHMEETRLDPNTTTEQQQDALLAEIVEVAIEAGEEAVGRTTEQLDVLAEAGVVDAGAHGLVLILAGFLAGLRGDATPPEIATQTAAPRSTVPHHEDSRYRYCTNFIVTGKGLESRAFVPGLELIGDSVLVVGDEATLKVHVHTDEPDDAVAVFKDVGEVQRLDVADMREQVAERTRRLAEAEDGSAGFDAPTTQCGVVVVTSAPGIAALFAELGAHTVDGGSTMNPSTYELLAGIHDLNAAEIIVLPCSPNVVMAAERAAELSERPTTVLDCTSQQAALAILFEFNPDVDAKANAETMIAASQGLRTGSVAPAARDDQQGRFKIGEAVGFVDDEVVAYGAPGATLEATVAILGDGLELLTVIEGAEPPTPASELLDANPGGLDLEIHQGGQTAYWWLLAAQ